ncbi:inositol monophosphatase family protein [Actinokineospora sp. NBRC 105648]|uniref:inositol monophosphatase family protein n=1 Tax=Actinokineospora sp. NBRC 105648 TaxID=3032206 RepID=UPI00249FA0E8|nr:inositol monophosphatase family protein [Actinokineospora sp. NBRC 105648]GLZ40833.1 inositol phosphatase [Actinokineospora sp. NBRC 105648]
MLNSVIEIVERVAADIPRRGPETPPVTLEGLWAAFTELDEPLSARLRDELTALGPSADEWTVDPMDGAVQYLHGLPQWCVTVALVRDGEPELAVLHSPLLGETYSAARGQGARRDGRVITPSAKTSLAAALATTAFPPDQQPEAFAAAGHALPGMLAAAGAVRGLAPTSWQVAEVAAGRVDVFWEFGRDAENLAGAALVAREAGARVSTVSGGPWSATEDSFLAAAPGVHAEVVRVLSR